ncbi:MAG: YjgN family protein [Desulfobacterales bacterium]|nr:YjgN family protein [Desulfobacterales bacterium]
MLAAGGARRRRDVVRTARDPGAADLSVSSMPTMRSKPATCSTTPAAWGATAWTPRMEVKGFMMLVLTNTLATALTLGLFHPWAKVRAMRYKAAAPDADRRRAT